MIGENLALCSERIREAASVTKISPGAVTLVAVTKEVALPLIYEAIDSGARHLGESRVQEALLKFDAVNTYAGKKGVRLFWHMIGHLQTNKVKEAVRLFDLIQSVDSLRLAQQIDKQAFGVGKQQDVLIEVKTSGEATKYGVAPEELSDLLKDLALLKNIRVLGLMTIAPAVSNPEKARPYFSRLKNLLTEVNQSSIFNFPLSILSMGMTDDFMVAVEEGATMVRIGRGIFNERITYGAKRT